MRDEDGDEGEVPAAAAAVVVVVAAVAVTDDDDDAVVAAGAFVVARRRQRRMMAVAVSAAAVTDADDGAWLAVRKEHHCLHTPTQHHPTCNTNSFTDTINVKGIEKYARGFKSSSTHHIAR
ncbi:hypothetical protein Pmani_030274 [Petrolisthes manimaculis]|uniref:Uncharacterized protein n=1 Tax=Petrolisthes manimaculis TaxID=1843537 RepID=A0AAE1NXQ1_9EUCA|nr:hypothetical protein Pmani_030274 [Petrolisthes manimaculis]